MNSSKNHMYFVTDIPEVKVKQIVDSTKPTNKRFNKQQFEKLYNDPDIEWVGLFKSQSECLALSAMKKNAANLNDLFLNEIQAFHSGGGYGKQLINNILKNCKHAWFMADVDGGEKLVNFYRQFDLKEHIVEKTIWGNREAHFFYTKDFSKNEESKLIKCIDEMYAQ